MSDLLTTNLRAGPMRKAFETWVKRTWHPSFREGLKRYPSGAYTGFDIQQSWFAFQAGWRKGRK